MRAVIETVFDIFYLVTVLTVGIRMIRGSKAGTQFRLFGLMAVVLGAGDSFHLVPRALALCTTGLENYAVPLGLGKWITSVTMTVFYVLLYYVWRKRYQIEGQKNVTVAVYALSLKYWKYKAFLVVDAPKQSIYYLLYQPARIVYIYIHYVLSALGGKQPISLS